jgi:hypothetical protein
MKWCVWTVSIGGPCLSNRPRACVVCGSSPAELHKAACEDKNPFAVIMWDKVQNLCDDKAQCLPLEFFRRVASSLKHTTLLSQVVYKMASAFEMLTGRETC